MQISMTGKCNTFLYQVYQMSNYMNIPMTKKVISICKNNLAEFLQHFKAILFKYRVRTGSR